jgi:PAS domain S-box-containing protein
MSLKLKLGTLVLGIALFLVGLVWLFNRNTQQLEQISAKRQAEQLLLAVSGELPYAKLILLSDIPEREAILVHIPNDIAVMEQAVQESISLETQAEFLAGLREIEQDLAKIAPMLHGLNDRPPPKALTPADKIELEQLGQIAHKVKKFSETYNAHLKAEEVRVIAANHLYASASIGITLLVTLIIVLILYLNILRPINILLHFAGEVGRGNYNYHAPIRSRDEFKSLADAFNQMAGQLQELIGSLERRIFDRTRRLETIAALSGELNAILDSDLLLDRLVNQVKERFNYHHAQIYLLAAQPGEGPIHLVLRAASGELGAKLKAAGHTIPLDAPLSPIAQAARDKRVVAIENLGRNSTMPSGPHSEMAVPIIFMGERVIGVLDVLAKEVDSLDEGDANLLRSLANQVAIALTNADLFRQTQIALAETETLYETSRQIIAAQNLSEVVDAVVEQAPIRAINRVVLFVFEYDAGGHLGAIVCQAAWHSGQGTRPAQVNDRAESHKYPIIKLFVSEEPLFFEDIQQDQRADPAMLKLSQRLNIRAMAVLPLWGRGRQLGVLVLEGEQPYTFGPYELRPYISLSGQIATIIENLRLLEQAQQRAIELATAQEATELAQEQLLQDITQRRKVQETLEQVTGLQKAILDSASYAIISTTPTGTIVTFNPAAERMLGYTAAEVVGQASPGRFHDPAEVVERAALFSQELGVLVEPGFEVFVAKARRNLPCEYEWIYIHKDGRRIPVFLVVTALRDGAGQINGFLGIASDITERKQAEQALLRAKEAAEQARQEAEIEKEKAETANQAMKEQIWLSAGQAHLSETMRGEQDIPTLANNIIRQLCHYLQAQVGVLYIRNGESLNLIGSYAYTRRKHLANEFKIGEGVVGQAAQEKQPILLTQVPPDYVTITSGLGETPPRHIFVTPFLYEARVVGVIELGTLTEFSAAHMEFIQASMESIAILFNTAQARARIDELLAKTQQQTEELQAQGEELRVANEELEAQTESLKRSEAQLKEKQSELEAINTQLEEKAAALQESGSALREKQAAVDRQNQELRIAQDELERKAKELSLASQYKSEFLANMSHELRTPLNSLLILAGMLAHNEAGNLTIEQVESAQIIYNSGQDLLNLINEILDLAKVEAGKMTFHVEPMALADLTLAMQTQFTPVAQEKKLDFQVTLADDLPERIETDPQRVKQIVRNLLSNAFKFTHAGSVSLNLYRPPHHVTLSRPDLESGGTVAIGVADTGIGMTQEQRQIIFEAFQQADGSTSRQYGGTGLGLSISRELAAKLGGEITVESEAGRGSLFTLYLPIARPIPAPAASQESLLPRVSSRSGQVGLLPPQPLPDDQEELAAGDKTLLIIEDDPNFAKIVANYGRKQGFSSLRASDGESGLKLVTQHCPDAIILDLHLPQMNGWQVLEALKQNPATRHIPVHIMSVDDESLEAYKRGAIGYLTKPVSRRDLVASFEKISQFVSREIKNLLLVEDERDLRQSIRKLLEGSDIKISEAGDGGTALSLLKMQPFDCMILDLTLPDMSGFEVLSRMNQDEAIPKCPVIVYTGRQLSEHETRELMKYADSVIVKGVKSPERLLDETALFLHRVVSQMPPDKQQTIKQLYDRDTHLAGKQILIVDDDMRNSFALSKLLKEKGLKVKIAPDGKRALEMLAEEEGVDLILMDIMMPVMDGYETIERIRAQAQFSRLPILALTAKAMKGDREKCLAAGANDYLTKPIDTDRLLSMLRVWLY